MDHSVRLLSSMSPMVPPTAKRILLKNKVPRKLALKRNVRRSSSIDHLPPTLQNNSLVVINSSLDDVDSPIIPKSRRGAVVVRPTADFSNQLSVTRYAEIKEWIAEVNSANNTLSDEECDRIIRKFVTERKKRTDLNIQTDSFMSDISRLRIDDGSDHNLKSNTDKDRTCIIISSSSSSSSPSFKSAYSDVSVVVIDSSINENVEYTIDKTNLIRSEPRKKKTVVKFMEPPKTEGKAVERCRQPNSEPSWLKTLKHLCDTDTTDSSLITDIFNTVSNRVPLKTSTAEQEKNKINQSSSPEQVKKQIRKKLDFNDIIQSLTNKENSTNCINNDKPVNYNNRNCEEFENRHKTKEKYFSKDIETQYKLDVGNKKYRDKSKCIKQNSTVSCNNTGNIQDNVLKEDDFNFKDKTCKQLTNKKINYNEESNDKNNTDKLNQNEQLKNTYRELILGDFSSDDEPLETRLRKNFVFPKEFRQKDCNGMNDHFDELKNYVRGKLDSKQISKDDRNDQKYFSDVSSDHESLEDKLRKKHSNFDDILKISNDKINILKENDLLGKKTQINDSTKRAPKPKPTKPRIKSKVMNGTTIKDLPTPSQTSEDNLRGFLESLSGCVKLTNCHPSARIFRNSFQAYKKQLATKLFKLYNLKIFDNGIPEDTPIEWNDRMRGTAGYCYCRKVVKRTGALEKKVRIVLSSKVLDSADRLRDTLVHEMCHAATWVVNGVANGHGDHWKAWTFKARQVFPELPPIKRCHDYTINTKYTYRCINCGYSFGRHSKSLDLNTKRCGYCLSRFELLINKKSKDGEVKTVPVTPSKGPTGFALFVKENYGIHKTPQLNHGQVMRLLGQKFNELKV